MDTLEDSLIHEGMYHVGWYRLCRINEFYKIMVATNSTIIKIAENSIWVGTISKNDEWLPNEPLKVSAVISFDSTITISQGFLEEYGKTSFFNTETPNLEYLHSVLVDYYGAPKTSIIGEAI
jgi:hypothetical protein